MNKYSHCVKLIPKKKNKNNNINKGLISKEEIKIN